MDFGEAVKLRYTREYPSRDASEAENRMEGVKFAAPCGHSTKVVDK